MDEGRRIEAEIRGTGQERETDGETGGGEGSEVSEEVFKEALSHHAAGVTVVAIRVDAEIHATTVSSFMPISAVPPTILVSVGGNARVLPFFDEGREFVVNLLSPAHRKLASVFADSFPVGPSPFPDQGPPEIPDALVSLRCRVSSLVETPGGRLVLGRVENARITGGDGALVHFRRRYHSVGEEES